MLLFPRNLTHTFIIEEIHPVSTNDMYFAAAKDAKSKYKNGKNKHFTYKVRTPELKEFQKDMESKLQVEISDSTIDLYKNIYNKDYWGLSLYIIVSMPYENYISSDSSNYIKAYEDCISRRLGIDDVNNLDVRITKKVSRNNVWKLYTTLGIYLRDFMYRSKKNLSIVDISDVDNMENSEKYYCQVCGKEYDKTVDLCDNCGSVFSTH